MADEIKEEKKNEPVLYTFGEQKLDLNKYIYNLGTNVDAYLNSKNWSEGQKEEFKRAYNIYLSGFKDQLSNNGSRFSTDSFGTIRDANGELSNIDGIDVGRNYYNDKGESITFDEYNKLKEKKQKKYNQFQANREVVNYFDLIGRKLGEYKPKEPKALDKFDPEKHGFMTYWTNTNFPSGTIDYNAILDMDPYNEENKKRSRANRSTYLAKSLNDFIQVADKYNYDFSGSGFTDKDDYIKRLRTAYNNLNNSIWNHDDALSLSAIGLDPKFYNALFSEEKDPTVTPEQKAQATVSEETQMSEQRKKEVEEAWKKEIERFGNLYKGNMSQLLNKPFYVVSEYLVDGNFDINKWYDYFNKGNENKDVYWNAINNQPEGSKLPTYIDLLMEDLHNNQEWNRGMQMLIGTGRAIKLENGTYYIPRKKDTESGTVLVYDPTQQQLYEDYIGNIHPYLKKLKELFIKNNYTDMWLSGYRKEGGIIQKFQEGGSPYAKYYENHYSGLDYQTQIKAEQDLKERAKKENRTEEQQKAAERYIFEDNKSVINPNAGFTSAEMARLTSGFADLISAGTALLPVAGTAVSLGTGLLSTAGNLYADIVDDSVSAWDTFKNAGLNLGMDLAGLVPGGGAASKLAKIGKTLIGVAPKVMAVLGTVGHISNTPQYLESWGKLKSEEKLTAQDWNNIISSIQALLGPTAAVGQYAKNKGVFGKNKFEKAQRADMGNINEDKIAVKMLDENGKEKTVLFEGEDVKAIREAQASGKMEDLKKATIDKFDDLKNYTLNEFDWGLRKPSSNGWFPVGQKPRHASNIIFDVTSRQGEDFVRRGKYNFLHSDITNLSNPGMSNSKIQADIDKRKQDIIDEMLVGSTREQKSKEKADKFLENTDNIILDLETKINGRKSTGLQADINNINTTRNTPEYNRRLAEYNQDVLELNGYTQQRRYLKDALNKYKADGIPLPINSKTGKPMTEKQAEAQVKALDQVILSKQQDVDSNKLYIESNSDSRLTDLQNQFNEVLGFEADLQKQTTRRQRIQDAYNNRWKTDNDNIYPVSREYRDFIDAHRISGDKISWDNPHGRENTEMTIKEFQEMLKKNGVIFKEGGSLNLNLVRSFKVGGSSTSKINTKRNDSEESNTFSIETPSFNLDSPILKYGLPRAIMADLVNRDLTKMAIDAEKPFLANPMQINKFVISDLNAENRGQKAAAQLYNMAYTPRTSDASLNTAVQMEATLKGQDFINQGLKASDDIRRTSEKEAWEQEKTNAQMRNNIAVANTQSLLKTAHNVATHKMAEKNKKYSNWEMLSKQLENEANTRISERKSLEDAYYKKDIKNWVTNNLSDLNTKNKLGLTEDEIRLYQQVQAGVIAPSSFQNDTVKWNQFIKVKKIAEELESEQYRIHKGIQKGPWSTTISVPESEDYIKIQEVPIRSSEGTLYGKDGTKLEIAKLRARVKEVESVRKQLQKDLDRNEKVLDRLSKSLYGYEKASKK